MKTQQLHYELKKAGVSTSGHETREQLVALLRKHLDEKLDQSAARYSFATFSPRIPFDLLGFCRQNVENEQRAERRRRPAA